jgi:hypothetical protein
MRKTQRASSCLHLQERSMTNSKQSLPVEERKPSDATLRMARILGCKWVWRSPLEDNSNG